jgi:hypothetical protein
LLILEVLIGIGSDVAILRSEILPESSWTRIESDKLGSKRAADAVVLLDEIRIFEPSADSIIANQKTLDWNFFRDS